MYNGIMPYVDEQKQRDAQKRYYEENKNKYAQRNRERRGKLRQHMVSIKEKAVCVDCLIDYPSYVLDFDHVRGTKRYNISAQLSNFGSIEALQKEIDKCDIVCANCHRHRTWHRLKKEL